MGCGASDASGEPDTAAKYKEDATPNHGNGAATGEGDGLRRSRTSSLRAERKLSQRSQHSLRSTARSASRSTAHTKCEQTPSSERSFSDSYHGVEEDAAAVPMGNFDMCILQEDIPSPQANDGGVLSNSDLAVITAESCSMGSSVSCDTRGGRVASHPRVLSVSLAEPAPVPEMLRRRTDPHSSTAAGGPGLQEAGRHRSCDYTPTYGPLHPEPRKKNVRSPSKRGVACRSAPSQVVSTSRSCEVLQGGDDSFCGGVSTLVAGLAVSQRSFSALNAPGPQQRPQSRSVSNSSSLSESASVSGRDSVAWLAMSGCVDMGRSANTCASFGDVASGCDDDTGSVVSSVVEPKRKAVLPGKGDLQDATDFKHALDEAVMMEARVLEVDHMGLKELPPSLLRLQSRLNVLLASHNTLRFVPSFIADFKELHTLVLSYNQLVCLPPEIFHLSALEELDLSHNSITVLPSSFGLLQNLKTCCLDFNDLSAFPEEALNIETLERLFVAENHRLETIPPLAAFEKAKSLVQVAVDNTPPISAALAAEPSGSPLLQIIHLNKIYPDKVIDNLYIGSLRSAQTDRVYEVLGIQYVVTCGRNMQINGKGILRLEIGVEDAEGESLQPNFVAFKEFLDKNMARAAVLCHCFAGLSRSATMVLSYLMNSRGMRLDTAVAFLMEIRPNIHPNPTFMKELIDYDAQLFPGSRPLDMTNLGEERTIRRLKNAQPSRMTQHQGSSRAAALQS